MRFDINRRARLVKQYGQQAYDKAFARTLKLNYVSENLDAIELILQGKVPATQPKPPKPQPKPQPKPKPAPQQKPAIKKERFNIADYNKLVQKYGKEAVNEAKKQSTNTAFIADLLGSVQISYQDAADSPRAASEKLDTLHDFITQIGQIYNAQAYKRPEFEQDGSIFLGVVCSIKDDTGNITTYKGLTASNLNAIGLELKLYCVRRGQELTHLKAKQPANRTKKENQRYDELVQILNGYGIPTIQYTTNVLRNGNFVKIAQSILEYIYQIFIDISL